MYKDINVNLKKEYKDIIIDILNTLKQNGILVTNMIKNLNNAKYNFMDKLSEENAKEGIEGNCVCVPELIDGFPKYTDIQINVLKDEDIAKRFAHEIIHLCAVRDIRPYDEYSYLVSKGMQEFLLEERENNVLEIISDTDLIFCNMAIDEAMTEVVRETLSEKNYSEYICNRYDLPKRILYFLLYVLYEDEFVENAYEIYFCNPEKLFVDAEAKIGFTKYKLRNLFGRTFSALSHGLISPFCVTEIVYEIIPTIEQVLDSVKNEQEILFMMNITKRDDLIKYFYYDVVNKAMPEE